MNKLLCSLIFCSILLTGCDNKDLLQSEKKIREQLENKNWERIAPSAVDYNEVWIFTEGKLAIQKDTINLNGSYFVDTKFSSSHVTITGLPLAHGLENGLKELNLNLKWTIAEINDDVLFLSASREDGAIKSLEFIKK